MDTTNEPVAWMHPETLECGHGGNVDWEDTGCIPLYTQDQLEEARKLGMQQERALWNLSESTQEIMNTHPVKELTDEEIAEVFDKCYQNNRGADVVTTTAFARAILRKAQEK